VRKQLVLWAAVLMIALQPVVAQKSDKAGKGKGGVEEQITKLSDEGKDAAVKNDASWVEKNAADDYAAILGNGAMVSKAEIVQMRQSGDVKYESIDVSDRKVRSYGNTAVMNATATIKGTMKGNDISGTYRITQVWVKQGGGWKVANMQSTKVQ
jgi:hypothetical protein